MTLGCKDIGIRKSEFVAKTQFLHENWEIKDLLFKMAMYVYSNILLRILSLNIKCL